MSSIKRQSVKEQIYDILKKKIMTQEYNLGDKINMLALAKELKVSNTPIREALSMLERDGLIEIIPNAGPRVIVFSKELFNNIAESVEGLLLGSYDLCLKKGKIDYLIEELDKTLSWQEEQRDSSNETDFAKATIAFDGAFMKCCENPLIAKLYSEVSDLFYLAVLYDHWYMDPVRDKVIKEHRDILDAVKMRDPDLAREKIKFHYLKSVIEVSEEAEK